MDRPPRAARSPSPRGPEAARKAMASSRAPSPPDQPQPDMVLADNIGEGDPHIGQRHQRLGIAGAEGADAGDLLDQLPASRRRARPRASRCSSRAAASASPDRREIVAAERRGRPPDDPRTARSPPPWRGRRRCRGCRPRAPPGSRRRCRFRAPNGPSRAPPRLRSRRRRPAWPKRSLSRPATMPTTPGCQPASRHQNEGRIVLGRGHRHGFVQDHRFDGLALAIVPVERLGQMQSAVSRSRAVSNSTPKAAASDTAAGIDARAEDEAQMIGREGRRRPCTGSQARPGPAAPASTAAPARRAQRRD